MHELFADDFGPVTPAKENHEGTQRGVAATKVAQTSKSISISRNRRSPRRFFVAQIVNLLFRRLAVGEGLRIANPRHGRLPVCATLVAASPRCAVSRVSKPAGGTTSHAPPIWKSAIQQVWKPALRRAVAPLENLRRKIKLSDVPPGQRNLVTAFSDKKATRFTSDAFKAFSRLRCPATKMWDTITPTVLPSEVDANCANSREFS